MGKQAKRRKITGAYWPPATQITFTMPAKHLALWSIQTRDKMFFFSLGASIVLRLATIKGMEEAVLHALHRDEGKCEPQLIPSTSLGVEKI